jgi:hypothetical protein
MTLTQRVCYEPGGVPTNLTQRTDAIAYDPALDRIYAQPRTFEGETLDSAQLAGYERATGALVEWLEVHRDIAVGGMAVVPGTGLVLGQGDRLDRYDLGANRAERIDDLDRFGVSSIQGLAVDAAAGTLVVVDGADDELVEIELARLGM